jgi:hypothetical protein
MFHIFFSLFLMILSNQNVLLSMFADFPRLILLCYFWKYKRMIKILISHASLKDSFQFKFQFVIMSCVILCYVYMVCYFLHIYCKFYFL